jgi:hypothetical protein
MSMLSVDLSGLNTILTDLGERAEEAARPAAQAAAQVLYDEVKRNVAAIPRNTGRLSNSIYQAFSQKNSGDGRATYHISWNTKKAKHGHLIEFGHVQRYVTYMGKDGSLYTARRPEARGKPKPGRYASQAEKDAYWLLRPAAKQVAALSFVRRAQVKFDAAAAAAAERLHREIQ